MKNPEAIKYVGLLISKNIVKRNEPLNAMVMLENTTDEALRHCVKLFIQKNGSSDWLLCSNRDYNFSPGEHLHAYLTISCEFLVSADTDEFLIFAGDTPPESDIELRGVSAIVIVED